MIPLDIPAKKRPTPITRKYVNLAGADFSNDPSIVDLNRSPDAVNMYRDYNSTQGKCVETRPGYVEIGKIGTKVNGFYFFEHGITEVIVHSGTNLYRWDNFPTRPEVTTELFTAMNNEKSKFFVFGNNLYINDGLNYLVYDGTTVKSVTEVAFIPTTTISRAPSGGGEILQPVNLLQPKRRNSFVGDGTSTVYQLDTTSLDLATKYVMKATVDGVEKTEGIDFTVNRITGTVIFNVAPTKPLTIGQDNVVITLSKTVMDYDTRIKKCTLSLVFDNRVFFSGNPDFPNAMFHCELENPAYISDLAYYQDGLDTSKIKSITVGNNLLWVFKESNQQNATIFYHTPTLDYTYGKIYPSKQGNISTGCYSDSVNFNDDIVFMSRQGLEGIKGDIGQEQVLAHRSSLVDARMTNENNFDKCEFQEWRGYLVCLIDDKIYLADSRQRYQGLTGIEYEWYYWDGIGISDNGIWMKPTLIKEYKGELFFCCENGSICQFNGTNDNGQAIYSCWTTPDDMFNSTNRLKTTNKRGGIAKLKTIPNGQCKLAEITNKSDYKHIATYSSTGFDFNNIDFTNFVFTTKQDSYMVYKIKEKKFIAIALKFYSDELDKPFGLYSATLEAFAGGYVRR